MVTQKYGNIKRAFGISLRDAYAGLEACDITCSDLVSVPLAKAREVYFKALTTNRESAEDTIRPRLNTFEKSLNMALTQ